MLRSKFGLLGLCLMAFGLMAFASSASAAVEWLILESKGVTSTNASVLPATIEGSLEGSDGTLLTKLIGLKISVLCTTATLTNTKLEGGGKLSKTGKVTFTGCSVPTPTGCTVKGGGGAVGTIVTNEGTGQLQTNGETLIKPTIAGGSFADLIFEGATCALPTGVNEPISGELWIKDCEGKAATHLVNHLIEESKAHGATLFIGKDTVEHLETSIDGSALVFLGGTHTGLAWGAIFP